MDEDKPMEYFRTIVTDNILDDIVEVHFYHICFALVKDPG